VRTRFDRVSLAAGALVCVFDKLARITSSADEYLMRQTKCLVNCNYYEVLSAFTARPNLRRFAFRERESWTEAFS